MIAYVDQPTAAKLRSFVERLENLEIAKAEIAEQIREVMLEAKDDGFDSKIIRQILKMRKMKPEDREELETLIAVYWSAISGEEIEASQAA